MAPLAACCLVIQCQQHYGSSVARSQANLDCMQRDLTVIHKDNERLLRDKEIMQAELQLALGNYQPKAVIDAGAPGKVCMQAVTMAMEATPVSSFASEAVRCGKRNQCWHPL